MPLQELVEIGPVLARPTDLLRLLAIPVFAWAAWEDVKVRRVPNRVWPPLAILGIVLLIVDVQYYHGLGGYEWQTFVIGAGISIGIVVPLVYGFWLLGGFGGADVKALATLALLFPTFPTYFVGTEVYPIVETDVGAFAFTILTNAVVVGLVYPLVLAAFNLARGDTSRWMFVGRQRPWDELDTVHGRLLETPAGFTRNGLDLDALRMYLRWRGIDLAELRERGNELRDPATLPEEPSPATDGAIRTDGGERAEGPRSSSERSSDGGERSLRDRETNRSPTDDPAAEYDDPWGAEAFLDDLEHGAYGTDPAGLREGLEVVTSRDSLWYSPGIPFIVPVFVGLVLAVSYGDLLFGALRFLGVA